MNFHKNRALSTALPFLVYAFWLLFTLVSLSLEYHFYFTTSKRASLIHFYLFPHPHWNCRKNQLLQSLFQTSNYSSCLLLMLTFIFFCVHSCCLCILSSCGMVALFCFLINLTIDSSMRERETIKLWSLPG